MLWYHKPKIQQRKCQCPLLNTNINYFRPPPTLTTYLSKIHLNVVLPSPSRSSKSTFCEMYPHQNYGSITSFPRLETCFAHRCLIHFTAPTILGGPYKRYSNILNSSLTSPFLDSNILLRWSSNLLCLFVFKFAKSL
jgi:hypothetical protein